MSFKSLQEWRNTYGMKTLQLSFDSAGWGETIYKSYTPENSGHSEERRQLLNNPIRWCDSFLFLDVNCLSPNPQLPEKIKFPKTPLFLFQAPIPLPRCPGLFPSASGDAEVAWIHPVSVPQACSREAASWAAVFEARPEQSTAQSPSSQSRRPC